MRRQMHQLSWPGYALMSFQLKVLGWHLWLTGGYHQLTTGPSRASRAWWVYLCPVISLNRKTFSCRQMGKDRYKDLARFSTGPRLLEDLRCGNHVSYALKSTLMRQHNLSIHTHTHIYTVYILPLRLKHQECDCNNERVCSKLAHGEIWKKKNPYIISLRTCKSGN